MPCSRKDFEAIASALAEAHRLVADYDSDAWCAVDIAADLVADALATTNSRFDRKRFLAASTKRS